MDVFSSEEEDSSLFSDSSPLLTDEFTKFVARGKDERAKKKRAPSQGQEMHEPENFVISSQYNVPKTTLGPTRGAGNSSRRSLFDSPLIAKFNTISPKPRGRVRRLRNFDDFGERPSLASITTAFDRVASNKGSALSGASLMALHAPRYINYPKISAANRNIGSDLWRMFTELNSTFESERRIHDLLSRHLFVSTNIRSLYGFGSVVLFGYTKTIYSGPCACGNRVACTGIDEFKSLGKNYGKFSLVIIPQKWAEKLPIKVGQVFLVVASLVERTEFGNFIYALKFRELDVCPHTRAPPVVSDEVSNEISAMKRNFDSDILGKMGLP